jgi:hypothetical protein
VPSFSGRVVAYPMRLPFVPDHDARVGAVTRFFERGVPQAERLDLTQRFRVTYVLLAKPHFADWPALLAELRPLGRVVYSSPEYELLRVGSTDAPDARLLARRVRAAPPRGARVE